MSYIVRLKYIGRITPGRCAWLKTCEILCPPENERPGVAFDEIKLAFLGDINLS